MNKIIVELRGGLGNQLFCYAFGYAISQKYGTKLIIDTSMQDSKIQRPLEINQYGITYDKRISIQYTFNPLLRKLGYNYIRRKIKIGLTTKIYSDENCYLSYYPISIKHNTYFRGYWQNWRYFDGYRQDIINMIRNTRELSENFRKLQLEIIKNNSVAVHFRRGDYLELGWELKDVYYKKALDTLDEKDAVYYIFSDSIDYSKIFFEKYYPNLNVEYIDKSYNLKAYEELILMSLCQNQIIANSSFSWWSAYTNVNLNCKIICPIYKYWEDEYYPEKWIRIEG